MFNQLVHFIVALMLFSIHQPAADPLFSPWTTIGGALALFGVYAWACFRSFRALERRMLASPSPQRIALAYHRLQGRLSMVALAFLAVHVYVLDIKSYLRLVPGFEEYYTLSGSLGLGFYLLHLVILRFFSYPAYRGIHRAVPERSTFLKDQLAFDGALLIPWLLVALASDVIQALARLSPGHSVLAEQLSFVVVLAAFVFLGPWLVVRLWRCEPLPDGPLRQELETFCREHRFRIGNFLMWPLLGGEALTAAVMGILPRLRYILVTRGILRLLQVEELKAVVAHEMGHVRRHHLLFYLCLFLGFSIVLFFNYDILLVGMLKERVFLQWALSSDSPRRTLFAVFYTLPLLVLIVVYFRFVFGFFMRNSERQADLYALQLLGHPFTLISSLRKIALQGGNIEDLPSWHHFSIRQRMDFLRECYMDDSLINRHNRKLYGSAAVFLLAVVALSWAGGWFQGTKKFQGWEQQVQLRYLEHRMRTTPGESELYAAYGGALLERKRYREAEAFLLQALELKPRDARTINNLAWLYATSPAPHFKPERALDLAVQAARLSPEPYILDTLAEAQFVNGHYEEALEAIGRALEQNPENISYYKEQKEKFEKALKELRERTVAPPSDTRPSSPSRFFRLAFAVRA